MPTKSLEKSHNNTQHYVHWFRHSAPYINAHRDKTFVLMFGGEAVRDLISNILFTILPYYILLASA